MTRRGAGGVRDPASSSGAPASRPPSVGDSYDHALAETVIGLYQTE